MGVLKVSKLIFRNFFDFIKTNTKDDIKNQKKNAKSIKNRTEIIANAKNKNSILFSIKKLENTEITEYNSNILMNKKIDYENSLSNEQKRVLTSIKGQFLVIAGAGSGKTRTIVYRTSLLLELGIRPEKILMITFTKKAALEMKERVEELLNKKMENLEISTFHSFCARQITKEKNFFNIEKLNILDEKTKYNKIKELIEKHHIKKIKRIPFPSVKRVGELLNKEKFQDTSIENLLTDREKLYQMEIFQVIAKYLEFKREYKLFEFDDLLDVFIEGMEKNENFRNTIQEKYEYIVVDEYQDSNIQQRKLLKNLVGNNGNLMVVGDDYQSIYGFRGANFENILRFSEDFPKSKLIKLETNYRSTDEIIKYCNKISKRFLLSYNKIAKGIGKTGSYPYIYSFKTKEKEASFIREKIANLLASGIKIDDIAILYRNKFVVIHILKELEKNNIKYYLKKKEDTNDDTNNTLSNDDENKDKLSVLSVHSSKGLEWDYVFMPAMLEGIFPSGDTQDIIEEEKRLYYVGCSRAKSTLYLTYPEFFYEKTGFYSIKSRFLEY